MATNTCTEILRPTMPCSTRWNKDISFERYYDTKINECIRRFVKQGRLPEARNASYGVHNVLNDHPSKNFLFSQSLVQDGGHDYKFTYSNVQGALNVIWRHVDEDVKEFRKTMRSFHDTPTKRWKTFYLGRVWSMLVNIYEQIYNKAFMEEKHDFKKTSKGATQCNLNLQVKVSNNNQAAKTFMIFEEMLPEVKSNNEAALVVIKMDQPNYASVIDLPVVQPLNLIIEEMVEINEVICEKIDSFVTIDGPAKEMATALVITTDSKPTPAPRISKYLRFRVDKLQKVLKDKAWYCLCDNCCVKFLLTSRFSSVLKENVEIQMDEGNARPRPPPNLSGKTIGKIVNSVRTVRTFAERHQEKMYVMCKKGRFAENKGDWDRYLFDRQRRALQKTYEAFRFSLIAMHVWEHIGIPQYSRIPHNYWLQSDYLIECCNKTVKKLNKTSIEECSKTINYIAKFRNVLYTIKYYFEEFDAGRINDDIDDEGLADQFLEDEEIYVEMQAEDGEPVKAEAKTEKGPLKATAKDPVAKKDAPKKATAKKDDKKKVSKKRTVPDGKAKVVKEKAVTKGETNKTLVLADQRTVDKQTIKKAKTLKPDSNTEINQDMDKIFKRMMFITRFKWDESTSTGEDLANFVLPGAYFSFTSKKAGKVCTPLTVNNMLSNYGFCRFDMKIRIQLNSSKMASGLLLVYFEPFLFNERNGYATSASFTNFPHIFVNVCESTSAEFQIPWQNIRDYFPIYCDYNSEYNYWGILHIRPFTSIRVGGTTSADTTISVYMGFENWEVHQQMNPKTPTAITFTNDLILTDFPNYKLNKQLPSEENFYEVVKKDSNFSDVEIQMENASGALIAMVPELGAILMEQLAKSLSRLSADAPLAPAPPSNSRLEVANVQAHGDGPHNAKSLSLTGVRQTPMRNRFLDSIAPSGYQDLLKMESFIYSFQVNTQNVENDTLFNWVVSPMCCSYIREANYKLHNKGEKFNIYKTEWDFNDSEWAMKTHTVAPSMLAYLAMGHLWWRGSLNWRFQAVKTPMHTMRLGIRYQPTGNFSTYTECEKISQPVVVWDIQESDELKLTTEFASTQPFLSTQYFGISNDGRTPAVVGNYACGTAEVFVINPLKKSTGVSDTMVINVFVSAGPDFEFAGTADLGCIAGIGKMPISQLQPTLTFVNRYSLYLEYLVAHGMGNVKVNLEPTKKRLTTTAKTFIITYENEEVINLLMGGYGRIDKVYSDKRKFAEQLWTKAMKKLNNNSIELFHPRESYLSYKAAARYLKKFSFDNVNIYKLLNGPERRALHRWLPIFHMAEQSHTLTAVPSAKHFPVDCEIDGVKKTFGDVLLSNIVVPKETVEIQADDGEQEGMTCDPIPAKGINPFSDGTSVDIASVHDLYGEGFMDMYQRLRRKYCIGCWDFPRYRDRDDTWYEDTQQSFLRMNPEEFDAVYWEVTIPVTPSQDIGWLGDGNRMLCIPGNKGKFCSTIDMAQGMGLAWGAEQNMTPLTWLTEVFTFWRGDIRMSFFFPDNVELFAAVVHLPNDYSGFSIGYNNAGQMMRYMNYGTALYKGNVMGELSVEIPWCSKYPRLVLSRYNNTAISQNGTVKVFIKMQRNQWARGLTKQVPMDVESVNQTTDYLQRVKLMLFMSMGETAELLVPRCAPRIWIHKKYYDNHFTDNWTCDNYDTPETNQVSIPVPFKHYDNNIKRLITTTTDGGYGKSMFENDTMHPFKSKLTGSYSENSLRTLSHNLYFQVEKKPDIKEPKEKAEENVEMQGEEGDMFQVSEEVYRYFHPEETDVKAVDCVDGVFKLTMDDVLKGAISSAAQVPIVLSKFNEIMDKTNRSWGLMESTVKVVKQAGESVSNIASSVIPKAWDATRLGLIAYSIYSFLNAESFNEKLMALMSGALGMGLNYEIVQKSFNWLISSVTSLFSQQGKEESIETQGEWSEDISQFIIDHNTTLKLAASAVGAFALFSFAPSGTANMTRDVTSFAQRMVNKLRNYTIIGAGFKTFEWLFEWIGKMFVKAYEWACDLATGGMLTKRALTAKFPEVLDWLSRIEVLQKDSEWERAVWDYDLQLEIWRLMDKGNNFKETISKKEPFLNNYIAQGMQKLEQLHTKTVGLKQSVPFRKDPYCIWLYGKAGVGKSAMANTIADFLGDYLEFPTINRTWTRNEDEEYWSGYIGQPIVMIDDIGQNKEGHALEEFIRIKSNFEVQVPMADIESKGRKFRSQVIVCTSNHALINSEKITCPPALWRRRNIMIEVLPDPRGRRGIEHNSFNILDPITAQPIKENLRYPELAASIAIDARRYLDEQTCLVATNLKGRKVPKLHSVQNNEEANRDRTKEALANIVNCIDRGVMPKKIDIDFVQGISPEMKAKLTSGEGDWNLSGLFRRVEVFLGYYSPVLNKSLEEETMMFHHIKLDPKWTGIEKQMEEPSEYDQLWDQAFNEMQTTKNKYEGFKAMVGSKVFETSWTHVADRNEIENVVKQMFPELTREEIAEKAKDWERVFNQANDVTTAKDIAANSPAGFNEWIKDEDFRDCFIKGTDGIWRMSIAEDKAMLEGCLNAACLWETVFENWEPKEFNKFCELTFDGGNKNPVKIKEHCVSKTLKNWVTAAHNRVEQYFEKHPWILKTLKLGACVAGFFLGYKLMKWICPETIGKIEDKLSSLFGRVKEHPYTVKTKEKADEVVRRFNNSNIVRKITNLFKVDSNLSDIEVEEAVTPIIVSAIENQILPQLRTVEQLKKSKVKLNAYYIGDGKHGRSSSVEAQGACDMGSVNVINQIKNNFVRLQTIRKDRVVNMLGIIVAKTYLLAPIHYFDGMQERQEIIVQYWKHGESVNHVECYSSEKLKQIGTHDAALYQLNNKFQARPTIIHHFLEQEEFDNMVQTEATLVTMDKCGDFVQTLVTAKVRGELIYNKPMDNFNYKNLNVFAYEASTSKGDCGSALIARNVHVVHKVLGFHVAGEREKDMGFSICVPGTLLGKIISSYENDSAFISLPQVQDCIGIPVEECEDLVIPKGNFKFEGIIKKELEVKNPVKTEIRKSPIHGLVREPVTEPAILSSKDTRWVHEGTPLYNAFSKYGKDSKPFYYPDLKYVAREAASDWYAWKLAMPPRVLTDHEAVFGNDLIPFCDRMNLKSSPGFPYVKRSNGRTGKAWLYDYESADGIKDEEYRSAYQQREHMAKEGKRDFHLWVACLKDERRKRAKIEAGKTRAFLIAGADWIQLFRKYFLAFCVNFYSNAGKFYSAVGIDPFSYEWTNLFRRLLTVGREGFGIDFENFDGLTDADLMYMMALEVNKWYRKFDVNWKPEDDLVRVTLMSDVIHSFVLVGNLLLWKMCGNASGCPITSVINTYVHACYMRLGFLKIMKILRRLFLLKRVQVPEPLERFTIWDLTIFRIGTRGIIYGDDGVVSVVKWLQQIFNLQTVTTALSEHGIVSTGEDKASELYEVKPLLECTFLKCGFAPMSGRSSIMLAPIAEDTIFELTNWVRKSDDNVAQMRENLRDALKFAFHHGEDFYRKFSEDINNAMHSKRLRSLIVSYDMVREEFLDKCY